MEARGGDDGKIWAGTGEGGGIDFPRPSPQNDYFLSTSYFGSAASTSASTLAAYLVKFSRKRPARSRAVVS